jgi:hypothetical protein
MMKRKISVSMKRKEKESDVPLNDGGYEETAVDIPCKSLHFDSPKSLDVSCKVQYTHPRCAPVQIVPTQIISQMEDDDDFERAPWACNLFVPPVNGCKKSLRLSMCSTRQRRHLHT